MTDESDQNDSKDEEVVAADELDVEEIAEDSGAQERKEYYLSLIQKVVEDQKEFLGEKVALKQARRAPLHIDKDGNVADFYGSGDQALDTLRQFTEHQEFYLRIIRTVVNTFESFLGKKTAMSKARKAPLFIDKDGDVSAYYGNGRNALDILVGQFETVLGRQVALLKTRSGIRDEVQEHERDLLPERIRPKRKLATREEKDTFISRLFGTFFGGNVYVA